jgi:hypothetical protein
MPAGRRSAIDPANESGARAVNNGASFIGLEAAA